MLHINMPQERLAFSNKLECMSTHVPLGEFISRQHNRLQLDGHLIEQVQTQTIDLSRLAVC